MGEHGRRSWLRRLEDELKTVLGPAQVSDPGPPRKRSADRLEGVQGDFDLRRGPDGRTYLVPRKGSGDRS